MFKTDLLSVICRNYMLCSTKNRTNNGSSGLFLLKKDLTTADISKFELGVNSLLKIKHITFGKIGKPALTSKRPIVDDT